MALQEFPELLFKGGRLAGDRVLLMGDSLPAEEDSSPARGGLESACL